MFIISVFTPLRIVATPFIATVVFVYFLSPLVKFLEKRRIKRKFAVLFVYLIVVMGVAILLFYCLPIIYENVIKVAELVNVNLNRWGMGEVFKSLPVGTEKIFDTAMSAVSVVTAVFVGAVAAFYILLTKDEVKKFFGEFIPIGLKPSLKILFDDVKSTTDAFFKGQIIIAFILFVIVTVFLYVMKIPYALALGAIAGVLDIVPYAGAFIAAALILMVTVITEADKVIIVGIGLLVIQQIENNFITPKISSDTLNLHPAVVILSLYVGAFGGFWGILLAVPLSCIFRKICQRLIQSLI